MPDTAASHPVLLVSTPPGARLPDLLRERGATVIAVENGLETMARAGERHPDVVVLDANLSGAPALDLSRALHNEGLIGARVPTLVLMRERPTPSDRVEGVRSGVWEFVRYSGPRDFDELWLKVQTFARAKHNIDEAIAEGLADPATGMLNGQGLVRRGREMVALMARERAPVSCLVVALADGVPTARGALVTGASRISDIVGALDARRFAVIAPDTDDAGAVRLAERMRGHLRESARAAGEELPDPALRVGMHAVGNVGYEPIEAVELLRRATAALDAGTPDPARPWVRRHAMEAGAHPRPAKAL